MHKSYQNNFTLLTYIDAPISSIVDKARYNLYKGFINPKVMKKMAKVFVGDSYTPDRHKKLSPEKETSKKSMVIVHPNF